MLYDANGNPIEQLAGVAFGVLDVTTGVVVATYWSREEAHMSKERLGGAPRYQVYIETNPPPDTIGVRSSILVDPEKGEAVAARIDDGGSFLGHILTKMNLGVGAAEINAEVREQLSIPEGYSRFLSDLAQACPSHLVEPTTMMLASTIRIMDTPEGVEAMKEVLADLMDKLRDRHQASYEELVDDLTSDMAKRDKSVN